MESNNTALAHKQAGRAQEHLFAEFHDHSKGGTRMSNEFHSADGKSITSRHDASITQKYKLREIERQFAAEDRREYEQCLANAREIAGDNEGLQSLVTFFELLLPLGVHPTYIAQSWTGWQYRLGHAPNPIS